LAPDWSEGICAWPKIGGIQTRNRASRRILDMRVSCAKIPACEREVLMKDS
jgi:hypothetical protein